MKEISYGPIKSRGPEQNAPVAPPLLKALEAPAIDGDTNILWPQYTGWFHCSTMLLLTFLRSDISVSSTQSDSPLSSSSLNTLIPSLLLLRFAKDARVLLTSF